MKKILKDKFSGTIGSWKKPIFIPTTIMNGESVEKVWDLGDKNIEKWFAILTSTAAPTYFDCIYDDAKNCYIDGGMWKNSPIDVLNAGLIKSGWTDYKILNFNTCLKTPNTDEGNKTLIGWAEYLISDWVARTSESGLYEAKAIIGDSAVFNASPYNSKKIKMDNVSNDNIQYIIDLWQTYYDANRAKILNFINKV